MKLLSLSLVALLAAGAASADTAFSVSRVQDDSLVELGDIRAPSGGTLEIYDFSRGQAGGLIGSMDLKAGVNRNVKVPILPMPTHDALAVIKVDGQAVAEQTLRFRD